MENNAAELAAALQLSVKAMQFYTPEHPRVVDALVHLEQICTPVLARKPRLTLTVAKGALLVDGEPFVHPTPQARTLAADLEKRQLGGIILLAGVTRRELLELVKLLALRPEQIKLAGGADEILKAAEIVHVRISHIRYEAITEHEEVVLTTTMRGGAGDGVAALPGVADVIAKAEAGDLPPEELRKLLETMANNDEQLRLLRERLAEAGMSRDQLDELLDVVAWDKLSLDERIDKLLAGSRIFNLPSEKLQHFVRELIDAGRAQDAHHILERYVSGLSSDAVAVRRNVLDGLAQVVSFPLSRETEQLVGTAILNQFVRETDANVKPYAIAAAGNLVAALIGSGRCEPAMRVIERLDATSPTAREELSRSLGEQHRAAALLAQVVAADPETLATNVMPLVARLGSALVPTLIDALGTEEDRNRRGRYVRVLKSIGEPAFPYLVDSLRSSTWYVVRNTLNVLGDIGTASQADAIGRTLKHGDPRVRRAAARALSKIGGAEAEALLVGAMNDKDAETQSEVLLCLGLMKAQTAIPGIAELAKAKLLGTDDKVRELAITTLGQIGTEAAVPVLGEILKPRGFFTRDSPSIRVAAAKALSTIATPAARDLIKSAASTESDRATKAMLEKLV